MMAASAKKMKQELRFKTKQELVETNSEAVWGLLAPAVADAAEAGSEADTDESEAIEETRKFFEEVTLWTFMDG